MKFILFSFITLLSLGCNKHLPPSRSRATTVHTAPSLTNMESDILRFVNQYRNSRRLPSLNIDQTAAVEALQHSRNMAVSKIPFGHSGFSSRVQNVERSIGRIKAAAENVAYGKMTAREVVDGWIRSKTHRANLEGPFNLIGIGVARNNSGTIYYTQLFIEK
jgi:uncharacterized protein YkwD